MTSQNDVPSFHTNQTVLHTPKIFAFECCLFIALKWLKDQNENLIQRNFNFTSNRRRFDVSMQGKKQIVYRNIILEICVSLAIKIKGKHKFMFLAKLFEKKNC